MSVYRMGLEGVWKGPGKNYVIRDDNVHSKVVTD